MSDKGAKAKFTSQGWQKIQRGHPWLFRGDIGENVKIPKKVGLWRFGEHWFLLSPQSKIMARRLGPATRNLCSLDESFLCDPYAFLKYFGQILETVLRDALARRMRFFPDEVCFRWIFSENDLLPGLIIDRYGDHLVVQILTAPMELFWPSIRSLVEKVFLEFVEVPPKILELRSSPVRLKEGLNVEQVPEGQKIPGRWIQWNGLEWFMQPGGEQKTGSFFDQKENHLKAAQWASLLQTKEAWDLCTYHGGFALHLAKSGVPVLALDESSSAIDIAQKNIERNSLDQKAQTMVGDVFDFLRSQFDQERKVDMIVLDPPAFAKGRSGREGALRGFKELNLRAMHTVREGGLLVSCCCSQNISPTDFQDLLQTAAHDARKSLHVLSVEGPSPDHAPLISFKEGSYLQAWFTRIGL